MLYLQQLVTSHLSGRMQIFDYHDIATVTVVELGTKVREIVTIMENASTRALFKELTQV